MKSYRSTKLVFTRHLISKLLLFSFAVVCLGLSGSAFAYDGPWPKLFDYCLSPCQYGSVYTPRINPIGFYDPAVDHLRNQLAPVPKPGSYLVWNNLRITALYDRVLQQERPLGVHLSNYTYPLGNNPNLENRDPQALSKTINYLSDLPAQGSVPNSQGRLDYVFMDFEPSWETIQNDNVAEAVNQVRNHPNPRINQAKIGCYHYFPCSTLPWRPYPGQNTPAEQQKVNNSYLNTGLNVAQPSLYPYEAYEVHSWSSHWGSNICPNARAALFWGPLAMLSEAKKSLPAGHELIPYINNMVQYTTDEYHVDPPTKEDNAASLKHYRLRGVDGYHEFRTYSHEMADGSPCDYDYDEDQNDEYRGDMLEAWTSLDWLFAAGDMPQILNLETNKTSGLQWSGVTTERGVAVLVSNLGNSTVWFDMPDVGPYNNELIDGFNIAPGTHRLEMYMLPIPGDANGDGYIDSDDAAILAQHWLQDTGVTWAMGDFNYDGVVNDIDATLLAANWNPQSTSVPEPSTACILLGVLGGLLILNRKVSRSSQRLNG